MTELVIPHPKTGEVLAVKTAATDVLAEARAALSDFESDLRSQRRMIDDELIDRMDHEGVRTFRVDGFKIETSKPTEREWDTALLIDTLDRLVADGIISQRKAEKCVKVEHKVVALEVRPLESDPRTQRQIAACFRDVPARRSVKVSR